MKYATVNEAELKALRECATTLRNLQREHMAPGANHEFVMNEYFNDARKNLSDYDAAKS